MPKVSVIVPVFNVEEYIGRCVRSLFSQTLDDVEFLFIDDCATDRSMDILQNILEEYPDRKTGVVIHRMERNSGQAAVRKWGMEAASGDYVIHCDSDDWIETDALRLMYEAAVSSDADIVFCDHWMSDESKSRLWKDTISPDHDTLFRDALLKNISSTLWNKLVKRSLYSGKITYPPFDMGEDFAILVQLVYLAHKVVKVDKPLYHYCRNSTSISGQTSVEGVLRRFNHSVGNVPTILDFLERNNLKEKYKNETGALLLDTKNQIRPLIRERKYFLMWRKTFGYINLRIPFNPAIRYKRKIKFFLTYLRLYDKTT